MKIKTSKGITLIALIITIIVLLILAGVTITMLTGENGILNRAVSAREETQKAEIIEQIKLDILDKQAEKKSGSLTQEELKTILTKYVENAETDIKYDAEDTTKISSIVTKKGKHEILLSEIWTGTTVAGGNEEETPPEDTRTVLEQATDAKPTLTATIIKENPTEGIVMVDDNGNEWVWIEVPSDVFKTEISSTDYDAIETYLIAYAADYRNGSASQTLNWTDEWYALDGETLVTASTEGLTDAQKALNNGCGLTYNEYQTAYNTMLSSVYTNKGFYISRYEIGDKESTESNTTRTSSTGVANTPVSQQNQIPYNYVTCSQAQGLANSMSTGTKTSSLMFGIQWDLVCKFLEENGTAKADIDSDSTSWGDYANSSLTLISGKYLVKGSPSNTWTSFDVDTENYVTSSQTSNNSSYYQLLTTGASDDTKKMNIYDFAGNGYEWTLEKTTNTLSPCSYRGGLYSNNGSNRPASYRSNNSTTFSSSDIAFRSTLY